LKIKTDFITNSSSSAFIVVWPNIVKTLEDVTKFISNLQHAKIIFRDIIDQSVNKVDMNNSSLLNKVADEITGGYISGISLDDNKFMIEFAKQNNITTKEIRSNRKWYGQFWDAYRGENMKAAAKGTIEFLELYGGQYVYFFNYGDNDGEVFSDLEHENDWGGLPYVRISQH